MIKDEDAKMKKTRLVDQKMIFFFIIFYSCSYPVK